MYSQAMVWLRQPEELLLRLLADELGLATTPPPATDTAPGRAPASDLQDTDVLPAIATGAPTEPLQTPVIPSPPPRGSRGAGWPDPDHGRAEDDPRQPLASPCSIRGPAVRFGPLAAAHRRHTRNKLTGTDTRRIVGVFPLLGGFGFGEGLGRPVWMPSGEGVAFSISAATWAN